MAKEQYKDYLAKRILIDSKPVTYRLLSRAIKVNVNTAKWMLFDFHQRQTAKNPKSVHATYLITGIKKTIAPANGVGNKYGVDVDMRSSPFVSSMPEPEEDEENEEPVKEISVVLAREEELADTRAEFEDEVSIHIYSLEPGALENLHVLSACNLEIRTTFTDEDPLERWKTYGSIHNPHIKRRTAKYAPPPPTKAPPKAAAKPIAQPVAKTAAKAAETSASTRRGSASEDNTSGQSNPQPAAGVGTLKRSDSKAGAKKDKTAGDIFKSFAKAKSKAKETDKSQESTPAPVEADLMQGMSEDEGDSDDEPEIKVDEEKNEAARNAREARAEQLRKMMEDDDEDMPDAPTATESQSESLPTDEADAPTPVDEEPTVTVQNGRRRGRRRVMKRKKVKDEDGYLVTKEEAVWESFSEEEPQPKKPKPAPTISAKGKPAGKKGQGSIASFFKKA